MKTQKITILFCLVLILQSCMKVDEEKFYGKTNPTGYENNYAYVDLGLSVKWATCNVGAAKPEEYGSYFAWGEIEPKSWYSSSNYSYDSDLSVLPLDRDAARANWGGAWRMPTDAEWTELIENCAWTWIDDYNGIGVAGRIVTSKINGNSIFLPAAGCRSSDGLGRAGYYGDYWSSSLGTDDPYNAWNAGFGSDGVYGGNGSRCCGQSVRPVLFWRIVPRFRRQGGLLPRAAAAVLRGVPCAAPALPPFSGCLRPAMPPPTP